jgi:predicted TPR repeat methyltransferase
MTVTEAMNLARHYQQTGNLALSEVLCRQVLEVAPDYADAIGFLAFVCQVQGRVAEGMALYERALQIDPNSAEVCNNLGAALVMLGRASEALGYFERAVRLKPDYDDAANNLRKVQAEVQRSAGTAARAPQADGEPGVPPRTAEHLNDEGVELMRAGRLDNALAKWEAALRVREMPEVHNNLGLLHFTRGELDPAVTAYQRALTLRPRYVEALNNLGIARARQQQMDDAVRCFQDALAIQPDYVEALRNLGNAWLLQGKPADAVECYRKALGVRADDAETLNNLGVALSALQQWDEAIGYWERSRAINPNDPQTHRNLGNAFQFLGRFDEALRCNQKLLALRPDDIEARLMVEACSGSSSLARLPAEYLIGIFDGYADRFDRDLVDGLGYRGPELLQAALGAAPAPRSLDVLDLGCGTGLCGVQFRDSARALVGVDLSPKMLARARERGSYDRLVEGDLLSALDEGVFDLILAGDVLVYFGDLSPLARAVARALRPGGRFAFTVEQLDGTSYRLLPSIRFAHSRAYLEELARQIGLQSTCANSVRLRTERGQGVAGLAVVWTKPK